MKSISIQLHADGAPALPFAHFEMLQGIFYRLLSFDPKLATEMHEKQGADARIKLCCFSDLRGRYEIANQTLFYKGALSFEIRSATDRVIEVMRDRLITDPVINLGGVACTATDLTIVEKNFTSRAQKFYMNTPIVAYKTDGGFTRYYAPTEQPFFELVSSNLRKKYGLVFGRDYAGELELIPENAAFCKKCVTKYKNTYINGYYGRYLLKADPDMIAIAYFCGLGSKNSMGFGTPDCTE